MKWLTAEEASALILQRNPELRHRIERRFRTSAASIMKHEKLQKRLENYQIKHELELIKGA